jgi:hypothetical protein
VHAAEAHLHTAFSKLSQTSYAAGDETERLVCAVSAKHNEGASTPYFWFAFHRKQLEFLEAAPAAWIYFGCGSAANTLIVPLSTLKPLLSQMSLSTPEDRHYLHVVIQRKGGKFVLRLLGSVDGPDLTGFLAIA